MKNVIISLLCTLKPENAVALKMLSLKLTKIQISTKMLCHILHIHQRILQTRFCLIYTEKKRNNIVSLTSLIKKISCVNIANIALIAWGQFFSLIISHEDLLVSLLPVNFLIDNKSFSLGVLNLLFLTWLSKLPHAFSFFADTLNPLV